MLRYVQSRNGVFVRHINDVEPTQWDENNFCFARKLTSEQATHFGVTRLQIVTPPYFDHATQRCEEGPAVLNNGVWTQQYVVTELDAEEVQARHAAQAQQVRAERDRLLASCDWTQIGDVPLQPGFPWSVAWPDAP
jgi:hypothetical protein